MDNVTLNDFVALQANAVKMNVNNNKGEVFYGFMKQTAEAQQKPNASEKKDTKNTKNTKENKVDKKEDTTKPETQQKENVTEKDSEDAKETMVQQVDLAMFAAAINTNIVPVDTQVEQTVTETPVVQTEAVEMTQATGNATEQAEVVVDTPQQQTSEKVAQTPQQTKVETEQTVSKDTTKDVEKVVEAQPKQQQEQQKTEVVKTETVKAEVKTEQTKEIEAPVVMTEEKTETKSDNKQMDTSDDKELSENTSTTSKRTFSDDVVNIKVGENTQITDANMAQKVSDKMLAKFAQHENEFEIQLMPKELGKITIKLVMQNGQAHVSMFAENAKTSSLLAEKAREISSIIEQNTGNETTVEVNKKEMQTQDQNRESKGEGFDRQKEEQQKQHQHKLQAERSAGFIQQMRLGLWNME